MMTAAALPGIGTLTGHTTVVTSVAFGPVGGILASGGADGTIKMWNVATGRPTGRPLPGDRGAVYSVAFSPDGWTLASGGADGTIKMWNVASPPDRRPGKIAAWNV
jgi:WD40 repeat protein